MSVRHIEVVINMLLGYRNVLDVRNTTKMYFAISTKMYLLKYIGYSLGIEVEILFFTYIKMLLHLDLESSILLFYYYCVN